MSAIALATADANGNITEYVDTNGTIVARYEYDAFGNTIAQSGDSADINPFRFSTKYTDDESGLVYYGYRFYHPELGRWVNRDPIGELGGLNVYGFVNNDPIGMCDALGEMPIWIERMAKWLGYWTWRTIVITEPHWREVKDAWYFEEGKNPVIYTGIGDPRNRDISTNPGFTKLLDCWIAKQRGESVPSGAWDVTESGIQWRYTYSRTDAAGGAAAYRCETEFLGTYSANVTKLGTSTGGKCRYSIHAWNTSGWTSGTRLPGFVADALRKLGWDGTSIFYDHKRREGPYIPSRGGNHDQKYNFETEADCCAKCVLP